MIFFLKNVFQNSLRKSLDKLLLNVSETELENDETADTDYTFDSDIVDIAVRVAMVCYILFF